MGCTGSQELPQCDVQDDCIHDVKPINHREQRRMFKKKSSSRKDTTSSAKKSISSPTITPGSKGTTVADRLKLPTRLPPVASLNPSHMEQILQMFNQQTMENQDPRVHHHQVHPSFNSLNYHYDVEDTALGIGMSGEVRLGYGKVTGRKVAIKTLKLSKEIDEATKLMLFNEIFIYLSVDHPNIVRLYDVYIGKDEINLVMEYAEGGELYKNLISRNSYCERDAAKLVYQMLSALVYLHSESICHRDLKLENWVYATKEPDSKIRLLDFGFARIFTESNPMRAPLGSIYYVSPEILSMKPYNEKTDMWSLGVIVYMMLLGKPPFSAEKDFQTLTLIKKGKVEFGNNWDEISDDAKNFVMKLLVRQPELRMSAQDAINHPWIVNAMRECDDKGSTENQDGKDLSHILGRMRNYTLRTEAYRHACNYIAKRAPNHLLNRIEDEFRSFDTNGTGVIEFEDWLRVMANLGVHRGEATEMFNSIDINCDGVIRYSSFVASVHCINTDKISDEFLKAAFQRLSIDPLRTDKLFENDLVVRFGEETGHQIFEEISRVRFDSEKNADESDFVTFRQFRLFMETGGILDEPFNSDLQSQRSGRIVNHDDSNDDLIDMAKVDKQQLCWENLVRLGASVTPRNETVDLDDISEVPTRLEKYLHNTSTFHLARGQSI